MHSFIRRVVPIAAATALSLTFVAPLAAAAQDDSDSTSATTDGTGVARVSVLDGNVAIQRGDANDSLAAALNAPVLGGDYLTTGDASRAEVQVDGYTQVRLNGDVQMRFTHLDPDARSLQLAAGTIDVRLLHGTDGTTSIDTPSITVEPQQSGSYRVTVTPDGQTLVTVRSGDAQIVTPQGAQDLQPGSTLIASGAASDPTISSEAAVALDEFDRFNLDRDRAFAPAVADNAYVDPRIGGVEDLPSYGQWVVDGSYGHVWVPSNVASDWAPYRDGRWVWEEGYGWTWIASEPWGWAPYHYGSWYNSPTYGWCWYPQRPAAVIAPWRPALVAFIGFGAGSGFALGFGGGNVFANIGWVPLAPFEPYHPWWTNRYGYAGPTVINRFTNVTNITNINVYKNVRYNAVSSVSSQRFLQGDFSHNVAVPETQLHQATAFHGAIPVVPTASNLRFSHSTAPPAVAVRPALMARSFAGNPAPVQRTPFTAQRVAFAATTHAVVTPLHFKDAQSTPLSEARATGSAPPAAAQHVTPEHAGPQRATPETNAEHATATSPATSAWSRFNETRAPRSNPAAENNASVRSGTDRATQTHSDTDHATPDRSDTYHPAQEHSDTYHPAQEHSDSYHPAPEHTDTYRPAQTHSDTNRAAPTRTDTYRPAPRSPDTYHAAPAHSDTYARHGGGSPAPVKHAPAGEHSEHPAAHDAKTPPEHGRR